MMRNTRKSGVRHAGIVIALLAAMAIPTLVLANPAAEAVRQAEQAFADSMAQRDFDAFRSFLAEDAVFFSSKGPDRGSAAVAERWAGYFEDDAAPFSWAPEQVEVVSSGDLGFSSGPVFNEAGERVATFHSVWRLEDDGRWRVVFDKGARWCAEPSVQE